MEKIKVGFCVAYDWHFLETSLPLIYDDADQICLSLDANRVGWAGQQFSFDEQGFANLLSRIDKKRKIKIFEDNFFNERFSPMENEVSQRNAMSNFLGVGGWHIQLDADEYFLDFPGFVAQLKSYKGKVNTNICVPFLILFKQLDKSWLMVSTKKQEFIEYVPVATRKPHYQYGRRNGYFNYKLNFPVIHQSWARSKLEIASKVKNWGHKDDFEIERFISFWEDLSIGNYSQKTNFHPLKPEVWPSLDLIRAKDISELVSCLRNHPPMLATDRQLKIGNSILLSKVRQIAKKLGISN